VPAIGRPYLVLLSHQIHVPIFRHARYPPTLANYHRL
jgi:hypothetical protein